jgi:hypothetical protein
LAAAKRRLELLLLPLHERLPSERVEILERSGAQLVVATGEAGARALNLLQLPLEERLVGVEDVLTGVLAEELVLERATRRAEQACSAAAWRTGGSARSLPAQRVLRAREHLAVRVADGLLQRALPKRPLRALANVLSSAAAEDRLQ